MTSTYNSNAINDHQFVIIKHSNDHNDYQIIQGYRHHYDLQGWNIINNANKLDIKAFLSLLQGFADNETFNSCDYNKMFGVDYSTVKGVDKQHYWSSVSFNEISDDDIIGYGDRNIAIEIEDMIDRDRHHQRNR